VVAANLNTVAARAGSPASIRLNAPSVVCPFLQCKTPSLQWSKKRILILMNLARRTGGGELFWSVGSRSERTRGALTGTRGIAFRELLLFQVLLRRRLMRMLQMKLLVAALFGAALLAAAAHAATFSGSSADITDFAGGSEVSTAGTLIDAVNVLNHNVGGVGVSTTINGVLFKGTQPGAFHEGAESFADASFVYHGGDNYSDSGLWTSGGAYDTLADSQIYNIDNGNINVGDGFGVVNLTPGVLYQLQVFMLDDRSGVSKTFPLQFQQVAWTGNADEIDNNNAPTEIGYLDGITIGGNGVTQANGEIATVLVKIDAGYNGLLVNTWDGGAINGMQLRQVPEPATLALCGMACCAFALRRNRKK
jgi:hypothetical protein